jgi:uncharacterized protein YjbI with pentapeptide repeats
MANREHQEILQKGVEVWNRWRKQSAETTPDLTHANLCDMELAGADFESAHLQFASAKRCDLRGAQFDHSDLAGALFDGAKLDNAHFVEAQISGAHFVRAQLSDAVFSVSDLTYANFTNATLRRAVFYHANLTRANLGEADLAGADLTDANFTGARLEGANLTSALMQGTVLAEVDLSRTLGLKEVNHLGPSTVGVDTLYLSHSLPASFLRGCGVPQSLIEQIGSLLADGQFYSCFLSHSAKDGIFADLLHSRLQDAQIRVWFAPKDVHGGEKLHEQVDTAIRDHDKLLIVLSEASIQSEWVLTELRKAFRNEKQSGKRKLFPIRLMSFSKLCEWQCFDGDTGKDLAAELRQYFIPDFSDWSQSDKFETALAALLKDLRNEAPARATALNAPILES